MYTRHTTLPYEWVKEKRVVCLGVWDLLQFIYTYMVDMLATSSQRLKSLSTMVITSPDPPHTSSPTSHSPESLPYGTQIGAIPIINGNPAPNLITAQATFPLLFGRCIVCHEPRFMVYSLRAAVC